MKILILFLLPFLLVAQDIDLLLDSYQRESELSKKTKDESAGNLIIYTRDDLERMQVESLKDILKSLRLFTYAENRLAQPDILNLDPITYYSKSVRVYLNENELLLSMTGSGLILFGDIEMDFINHVEIYEGFPSLDLGIEPATVVIRLYTKDAKHDEGSRIKGLIGSHGTNKVNVYNTNQLDEFSYFVYANRTDEREDRYEHQGQDLKRDQITNRFYGSLSNENHNLELHVQESSGDAFLGSLVGNTPEDTTKESLFLNISTLSKFMDDSLTLNLSYIDVENTFSYRYDATMPVPIPIDTPPGFVLVRSLDQTIKEEAFTAQIKKEWELDNHALTIGAQYRYKHFDLTDVRFDVPIAPISQPYYTENVYSLFLQDSISFNENHLMSLSVMNQIYQRLGDVDDPNLLQLRLGYIYSDMEWVAKTFISKQAFASEPYMTISPHYGNENLEPETYTSIFQELSYESDTTLTKLILGYGQNEKMPTLDMQTFRMKNSEYTVDGGSVALEFTLHFNEKDKLELQANYVAIESADDKTLTEHYNYLLRMLNSYENFDFFNELLINQGYANVDIGYNYSLGVTYAYTRDFIVSLKGENIFDSGLKQNYVNQVNLFTKEITDTVQTPRIEQKFMFVMEYLF